MVLGGLWEEVPDNTPRANRPVGLDSDVWAEVG